MQQTLSFTSFRRGRGPFLYSGGGVRLTDLSAVFNVGPFGWSGSHSSGGVPFLLPAAWDSTTDTGPVALRCAGLDGPVCRTLGLSRDWRFVLLSLEQYLSYLALLGRPQKFDCVGPELWPLDGRPGTSVLWPGEKRGSICWQARSDLSCHFSTGTVDCEKVHQVVIMTCLFPLAVPNLETCHEIHARYRGDAGVPLFLVGRRDGSRSPFEFIEKQVDTRALPGAVQLIRAADGWHTRGRSRPYLELVTRLEACLSRGKNRGAIHSACGRGLVWQLEVCRDVCADSPAGAVLTGGRGFYVLGRGSTIWLGVPLGTPSAHLESIITGVIQWIVST